MERGVISKPADHTIMWNLTSFDVNQIKGQLQARRARIEAKYAEKQGRSMQSLPNSTRSSE